MFFPTEAMQWIKEVELVDSVDDLRSSSSTRGISMPNFEVLDARIASALNKIIHDSHFIRKISLEEQKAQKEDRFLRGRQIAYLIYEQFRVTGTDDSVENYTDLFTIVLRNDDNQEFDSKWDGILLSMRKIPHDDILEGLHKFLGDCFQWETNGQCVKGTNCSFRHDMDKRGKSSPSNPSQNSFMQQSERKPIEDPKWQR